MPSSVRKVVAQATEQIRNLQKALGKRRCDHLLVIQNAAHIIGHSEALEDIATVDEHLLRKVYQIVRDAVCITGTIELSGAAPGVTRINDAVGRLICTNQLPTARKVHLLAAAIMGAEAGLRALLSAASDDRAAEAMEAIPLSADLQKTDATGSGASSLTGTEDDLDQPSSAPAAVPGRSRGRHEIKPDTEKI